MKKVDADGWTETIVVKEKKARDEEKAAKRAPKVKKEKKPKATAAPANLFNLLKDA